MLKNILHLAIMLLPCCIMAAVQGVSGAIPAENTAKQELENMLKRFPANALPEVVLKYDKSLGMEEFVITRKGNGSVVIAGGRPRGVLYGALEFMERAMGVRFCSVDYVYVPSALPSALPADFVWKGKPAMISRYYYDMHRDRPATYRKHHVYSRMNAESYDSPEYGFSEKLGLPRGCHTFLQYCEDLPAKYGWMNKQGKRIQVKHTTAGQLCYSLPEVRAHVLAKLKKYIAADRAACDKTGAPYPRIYDISANDCNAICYCAPCQAFAKKHNVSGLVLNFVNQIAREIAKTHPDIMIQTFAYKDAMIPPKGNIATVPNVIINCAFMDVEFGAGAYTRDVMRPLDHPQQKWYREQLQNWRKYTGNLSIWDYWKLYYEAFPNPKGGIRDRADYVKFYHQLGACKMFIEAEIDDNKSIFSFTDLRSYQAAKLMWDPYLDSKKLISDYMNAFYGKAAPAMSKFLDFLEDSMAQEPSPLGYVDVRSRKYCTPEFFAGAHQLLDEAEALAAGDQARLNHIAQERLVVDIAEVSVKGSLAPGQGERIRKAYMNYVRKYYSTAYFNQNAKVNCDRMLAGFNRPALPEKFAVVCAKDLCWADFERTVVDADAAGGRCLSLLRELQRLGKKNTPDFHSRDLMFGVYDRRNRKNLFMLQIPKAKLPQDEKYHIYYLGKSVLNEECGLWAHWSWNLGTSVRALADRHMPDRPGEVYVSLKVQGPSYVKGSKQVDDVRIDRVFYVPWDPDLLRKGLPKFPAELNAGENYREKAYCDFPQTTADSDAAGGQAVWLSVVGKRYKKPIKHTSDLQFGIYDSKLRKAVTGILVYPKAKLPQDEKFHYYYLGRIKLSEASTLWIHQSWYLGTDLKMLFDAANPDENGDVYVSIKVQGPSYVKDSRKADDVAFDRVIFVPAKADTPAPAFAPGSLVK